MTSKQLFSAQGMVLLILCGAKGNGCGMSVLGKVLDTNVVLFQMLKGHFGEANKPVTMVAF